MKLDKILPHVAIYFILMMASFFYFRPIVFEGKSLREHDNVQARGMQAECHKYKEKENRYINWTDQVFLGMPTYQIYGNYTHNMIMETNSYLFMFKQPINAPHIMLFFMMLFAYIGLLAIGVDKWISLLGALSFGFATNNLVLFDAGHSTKLHAMIYMAPALAGTILAFRGKWLWGASLAAFALAAQIAANHLQITYYTFLMMAFLGLAYFIHALVKKEISVFFKAALSLSVVALLSILSNLGLLWTTYEYSAETIRGGTELKTFVLEKSDLQSLAQNGLSASDIMKLDSFGVVDQVIKTETMFLNYMNAALGPDKVNLIKKDLLSLAGKTKETGLDKDYIFQWSYGIMETFTLLVPHFYGGTDGRYFADDASREGVQLGESNSAQAIQKLLANADPKDAQNISQELFSMTAQYWGAQPFTSGPVYLGAIICLLFVLSLLILKGPIKWGFALVTLFFVMLSWGDNFKGFNYFMVDHFPMLNKFRAVTMALSAVQLIAVFMAVLGLQQFIHFDPSQKGLFLSRLMGKMGLQPTRLNYLYVATGITASLCLFVIFYSMTGSMEGATDQKLQSLSGSAPQWSEFYEAIKKDRAEMMLFDALRSLVFVMLGSLFLWLFASGKIKQGVYVIGALSVLVLADLIQIDRLYVNDGNFVDKREIVSAPSPLAVDQLVLRDPDPHYRVYDMIAGMRESGRPGSPFQSSEGAYFHKIVGGYHAAKPISIQELNEYYLNRRQPDEEMLKILGMMNVKYVLLDPERPTVNNFAQGNAWFVDSIDFVNSADEELAALGSLVPWTKTVTRASNQSYLQGLENKKSDGDVIKLKSYHPEKLVYQSQTGAERFALFSEIYYPPHKGWKVYVDGKPYEKSFIKVNYLLRGMRVPAGNHEITFAFEPDSHRLGENSALICSSLILLVFGFSLFKTIKENQETKEEEIQIPKQVELKKGKNK